MSTLKGGDDLRRRLKALKLSFKPIGKRWADDTSVNMRGRVPVRTGRLRGSFKRKEASQRRARVVGHYTAYFVDKGPVPHTIKARGFIGPTLQGQSKSRSLVFKGRQGTVFAKQVHHRGYRGRPFRARAAQDALSDQHIMDEIYRAWNDAA